MKRLFLAGLILGFAVGTASAQPLPHPPAPPKPTPVAPVLPTCQANGLTPVPVVTTTIYVYEGGRRGFHPLRRLRARFGCL